MFCLLPEQYTIKKTATKGRGVFATAEIEPGAVIGDYLGIIVDDSTHDQHSADYGLYGMSLNDHATIVPEHPTRNTGIHLINHSCEPNCAIYPYQGHILYFALRRIFPGEELMVSYLLDPPSPSDTDVHPCLCNSYFCKGTMYLNHDMSQRWYDYFKKKLGIYFKKKYATGTVIGPLKQYPKAIADARIYDLFGCSRRPSLVCDDLELPTLTILRDRIRQSGRMLLFPRLHLKVIGVVDDRLIAERTK